MINKMRWCRKFIGHRHITDRYVALHHKHLRNASSSLQGDAQLTLAYNMNKNSRVMLHNSLFMSCSFSKIVSCHLHIVLLWWQASVYKDRIGMCLKAKCSLELQFFAAHSHALACGQVVILHIHLQQWTVFCLHRTTLQCWHMSSGEFAMKMRLITLFDAQV